MYGQSLSRVGGRAGCAFKTPCLGLSVVVGIGGALRYGSRCVIFSILAIGKPGLVVVAVLYIALLHGRGLVDSFIADNRGVQVIEKS